MKRSYLWGMVIGLCLLGGVLIFGLLAVLALPDFTGGFGSGVAVLKLEGTIVTADEFLADIEKARTTERVRAVVLRVNSPGGSVGASQEIYLALKRLAAKKPLVASFGNVAASGGYYAGIAAQRIFALPGTITASIGVRMSHLDAEQLIGWLGLKPETLKSGYFKDVGAMHRPMRDDERALLVTLLETMHAQFKAAVAEARKIEPAALATFADGRVVTGEQAVALGLIDEIGDFQAAVQYAAAQVGLSDEPRIIPIHEGEQWWTSLLTKNAILQSLGAPLIGYLWSPSGL